MRKRGSWITALMLIVLLVSGCSSGSQDKSAGGAAAVESQETSVDQASNQTDGGEAEAKNGTAVTSKNSVEEPASADAELPNMPSPAQASGAGFNSQDLSGGLNKKLMYKANIVMEIQDYGKAQSEVRNTVTLSGGYIVNFSETQSSSEKGGTFIVKVPANDFSSFLNRLENIAHENLQRSIEGQDVTEEYVDLESRLKAKQIMEEQYVAFMKKATKTTDLVAFANELERIQSEIEQMKGRMRYIDQNVSYSTVEIRLYETPQKKDDPKTSAIQAPLGQRISQAFQGSIDVITIIVQWIIVILSGSLPVLVIAAFVLLILWLARRSGQRKREEVARKRKLLNNGPTSEQGHVEGQKNEEKRMKDE
ncbi:DUF4349 domain-containing protein [Paenibacillus sp. ISL-20]|uniref:DUF4349 domain-containing protein n=1 Tax=Paenibacillus sp. ISL-20 TaxID=2819163 RepID=UPI001BECFE8F|nr:DUF4349 domain-containing protein [Paenibacillus sp. ISL-20]MBT2765304.1 DUF4349 domain-containing protein [Paenibacillus sp. ISL-20]